MLRYGDKQPLEFALRTELPAYAPSAHTARFSAYLALVRGQAPAPAARYALLRPSIGSRRYARTIWLLALANTPNEAFCDSSRLSFPHLTFTPPAFYLFLIKCKATYKQLQQQF